MLCNKKLSFLFPIIVMSLYIPSLAVPIPALELTSLTQDSNLIVVGRLVSVKDIREVTLTWQGQSIPARSRVAELRTVRILKGQPSTSTVNFQFIHTTVFLGFEDIRAEQFGMFFLKLDSQHGLTVTNLYYPFLVSAIDAPVTDGSDFERVVAAVSYVIRSAQTSFDDKVKAVAVLDRVNTPAATEALRLAADTGNENLRLNAVTALLKRSDITRLEIAERALLRAQPGTDSYLMASLAVATEYVKDPTAIPVLYRLLGAGYTRARRSAAAAIRHIGTNAAIEPLTQALYDNDQDVRYHAVIGLAEITGQDAWGPTTDKYNEEEQRYLEYWRKWARKR